MNIFTKLTVLLLIVAGGIGTASAQLLKKIGDNPSTLNPSAALEIESTTKGFLPPRMTTANRDAMNGTNNVSKPATGLLIYNTTTNSLEINIGTADTPNWKSTSAVNPSIKTITSNYGVRTEDDTVLVDASAAGFAGEGLYITLPPTPSPTNANPGTPVTGKIYTIGKIDTTDHIVNFDHPLKLSSSVTVGTSNTPGLFRIQYDGSSWVIID